jgi:hypothetical protein
MPQRSPPPVNAGKTGRITDSPLKLLRISRKKQFRSKRYKRIVDVQEQGCFGAEQGAESADQGNNREQAGAAFVEWNALRKPNTEIDNKPER